MCSIGIKTNSTSLPLYAIRPAAWWSLVMTDWFLLQTFFICLQKKNGMFVLKKCNSMPGGRKGQEWGKCVCMVHGKFLHCLQLQSHSKTVQSPSFLLRSGTESSHYLMTGRVATQKGPREKLPLSKRSICFNLEGQKKNQMSITVLKYQRLPFLIGTLCWHSSRQS